MEWAHKDGLDTFQEFAFFRTFYASHEGSFFNKSHSTVLSLEITGQKVERLQIFAILAS